MILQNTSHSGPVTFGDILYDPVLPEPDLEYIF